EADSLFRTHPELFWQEYPPEPIGSFDPQTGYLIDGVYLFRYLPFYADLFSDPDRLYIRDGKIFQLTLKQSPYASLDEVINRLGMPDQVHLIQDYPNFARFDLIYLKWRLRVLIASDSCRIGTVRQDMAAVQVRYYSPQAANEINTYISYYDVRQPALTA